jgi:protein SCO1
MKRSLVFIALWLFVVAALILRPLRRPLPPGPLVRLWPVPAFEMTGVTTLGERPLRQKDLLGHPWIADFIFTSCGGPCPIMSGKMAALQRVLPPDVRLVSFTVDPDHDTPAVLKDYAGRFHADPTRWTFARGDKEMLYKLVSQGFRLSVAERHGAPPETRIMHNTHFVLVDSRGVVRGFYDSHVDSFMENLRRDVNRLISEGQ